MRSSYFIVALCLVMPCACATCPPTPPEPRCWEGAAAFPFLISEVDHGDRDGAMPPAERLPALNAQFCGELAASGTPEPANVFEQTCQSAFQSEVMDRYCKRHVAPYCKDTCPGDQDACSSTGAATLHRRCAEANLSEFRKLMPYCADFDLRETVLVRRTDAAPRCTP